MQEHKIILTWEAIYDITDILEYIESEFGVERADQFQNDIKKQLLALSFTGSAYGNTYILYRSNSIYKKPFLPSLIFYIVKEPEKEIHILRVLREESNWQHILEQKQEYTYPNE